MLKIVKIQKEHMVNRVSSYFPKGGHSATETESISSQFSLYQLIEEPTHLTDQSSSIIELLFVTNNYNVILSRVVDPFLRQNIRYHCPICVILSFLTQETLYSNVIFGSMIKATTTFSAIKHLTQIGVFFMILILVH